MNINKFAKKVAEKEGLKKQVNIAQIKEVMRVVNILTKGALYAIIRMLPVFLFFFICFNSYSQFTPISYWTFESGNTSTSIKDSMGYYNLNFAAYGGTVAVKSGGAVGRYGEFSSSSALCLASPAPSMLTDSFAIEFIMRTGHRFNTCEIFRSMDGSISIMFNFPSYGSSVPSLYFKTVTSSGQHEMIVMLDGVGRKNMNWFVDGGWHHFVFQYKPTTGQKEIWIDGQLPAGFSASVAPANSLATTSGRQLIFNSNTSYRKVFADIDEIAVYRRFLSPQIIYQHYLNMKAGNPYQFSTAILSIPNPSPVSAGLDTMEFPVGWNYLDYSKVNTFLAQFARFPLPRYRSDAQIHPNFNWVDLNYACGYLQSGVSVTDATNNITAIQRVLSTDWNYMIQLHMGMRQEFTNATIAYANANPHLKLSLTLFRIQLPTLVLNQNLPDNHYLRNSSGQFLHPNGSLSGSTKYWSPVAPVSSYTGDGYKQRDNINSLTSGLTRNVNFVNENGEIFSYLTAGMQADPHVTAAKNASGLGWMEFAAQKIKENENQAYRDIILNQCPKLSGAKYTYYILNGQRDYNFRWEYIRDINTPINYQYYPTGDLYVRWPHNWRNWSGAWHGLDWFIKSKKYEERVGDRFMSPFVAAGWSENTHEHVRPAQWMGLLKVMAGLGSEFFYTGYFNEAASYSTSSPPFNPKGYAWQLAIPSYVQAAVSREYSLFKNSVCLPGDYPFSYESGGDSSFIFYSGNLNVPVVVRKHVSQPKYMIFCNFNPVHNMYDTLTRETTVTVNFDGNHNVKFRARRQGSIYVFDKTDPSDTIFYQLDGWHQYEHPERWTKDIIVEAELYDGASTSTVRIGTEGNTGYDFRNALSYIGFIQTGNVYYEIKPNTNSSLTRFVWIRARSSTGVSTGITIKHGSITKKIDCITDKQWRWYRTDPVSNTPVMFTLTQGANVFTIHPINMAIEIDKIAFVESGADIYGETPVVCTTLTASITPAGPIYRCKSSPPTLTASQGTSYLWSTGSTSRSITVNVSGTYTVTVTVAGQGSATASAVVVINNEPVLIHPADAFNICPEEYILLGRHHPVNIGEYGRYSYHMTREDAINNIRLTSDTVYVSSTRYYRVTTELGCYAIDSIKVTITECRCHEPPIADAGTDIRICSGSSVQLNGITYNDASGFQWLPSGGYYSNPYVHDAVYYPSQEEYAIGFVKLVLMANDVDGDGPCVAHMDTVTVTFLPSPPKSISASGPLSFCSGEGVWLIAAAGNYNYKWYRNGSPLTVNNDSLYATMSGWYKASIGDGTCGTTTDSIYVNVYPVVPNSVEASPGLKTCGSVPVTLTVSTGSSFRWSTGATTRSITVQSPGTYTVTVTDVYGCKMYITSTVTDTCAVSGCVPPYGLYESYIGRTTVNLRWGGPSGSSGFVLFLENKSNSTVITANYDPSKRSVWIRSLSPGTTYRWWMATRCTSTTLSGNSVKREFTTK